MSGTPSDAMMSIAKRIQIGAAGLLLVLALVLPTIVGQATTYAVLAVGIGTWLALLFTRRLGEAYGPIAGRWWLIAFVLLAVLTALTMKEPGEMLRVVNFIMVPLGGAFLALLWRVKSRIPPGTVSLMAAAGVLLTLVMIAVMALGGNSRPEGINLGPIILPNACLALSAVAATGAIALRTRWSLALPLAVAAAIAVILISQSRGPLIAVVPLVALTLLALWRTRLRRSGWWLGTIAVALVAVGVGAEMLVGTRANSLPGIITNVFNGGTSGDETTDIRLALYRAGWRAFLDAPWLGHGWARMMTAPMPYVDPAFLAVVAPLHHLHNDLLYFAVGGGVVGVGLYLLILLTPLVAAYRSARDTLRPARLYGTTALAIVYACAGLTDIALAHEFHRMMFVVLNAVVLGLVSEGPAKAPDTP
jgi:O-antigen ligase